MRKKDKSPKSSCFHCYTMFDPCTLFDWNLCGHLLEIQKTSEGEIWNDTDCFIEIIYTADQTIKFENAENFSIERADRLLYNADKNVLYWGEAGYQNCLDYTKMNEEMQAHKEEILKGYEELSTSIRDCFNQ